MKLFNFLKKKRPKENTDWNSLKQEGDISEFSPLTKEENESSIQMVLSQLNKTSDGFSIKSQPDNEIDETAIKAFNAKDLEAAVQNLTGRLEEIAKYTEEAKKEYASLTANFSDIQIIEDAPSVMKSSIRKLAEKIMELAENRKKTRSQENSLSNSDYSNMEKLEPDMPKALTQLQGYEATFQSVKNNIKILEGEKTALRYDARDLIKKQRKIKKYALFSVLGLIIVFGLFIVANFMFEIQENFRFVAVAALAALLAIGMLAYLKKTEREVLLTEIRLNKTAGLLNSTKIRYVNSANMLDYQYAKYGVKSSYELSVLYESYLQMKKQKQKINRITDELSEAEYKLELLLKGLNLNDPYIWLSQVKAISDPEEMASVKQKLKERRQKLRTQIEYNIRQQEETKKELLRIEQLYEK